MQREGPSSEKMEAGLTEVVPPVKAAVTELRLRKILGSPSVPPSQQHQGPELPVWEEE